MSRAMRPALAALVICAAAFAAFAGDPVPPLAADEISAVRLAEWIRARRPGLQILDTRSADAMARGALPGARSLADFEGEGGDTVVLYGEGAADTAPLRVDAATSAESLRVDTAAGAESLRADAARVLRLRGGLAAWHQDVLFPELRSDAPAAQRREFARRAQLSRYFGGSPRVIEPGAPTGRPRSRRGC